MNKDSNNAASRDDRLLAVFSLVTMLVGVFGTIGISVFDPDVALVFAAVALVLTLVFGFMSWPEKLARVAVVATGVMTGIIVIMGAWFFILGSASPELEQQRKIEQIEAQEGKEVQQPGGYQERTEVDNDTAR